MLAAGDVFKKTKNSTQHRGIAHSCERKSKWCIEITRLYILWLWILVETMEKEDCKQLVKHLKI